MYKSFDAVNHKNILKFVTCDETRLRLVVALHNRGSVYTAIQRDVLSLPAFQLLAETMSSGKNVINLYMSNQNLLYNLLCIAI